MDTQEEEAKKNDNANAGTINGSNQEEEAPRAAKAQEEEEAQEAAEAKEKEEKAAIPNVTIRLQSPALTPQW